MNINLQLLSKSQNKAKQPAVQSALKTPSGSSHGLSVEATPAPVYGTAFSGQKQRATGATQRLEAILEELESFATYSHEQGGFIATRARTFKYPKGSQLGYTGGHGYKSLSIGSGINKEIYLIHRLVWLWFTGHWPRKEIDHIDQDKNNNRIENLRDVPRNINHKNIKRRTNAAPFTGVQQIGNKWAARIMVNYKNLYLGLFTTPKEAAVARAEAIESHPEWGFTEQHGTSVQQSTRASEVHPTLKITL